MLIDKHLRLFGVGIVRAIGGSMSEYKYEVLGYLCQAKVNKGSYCEIGCDTIAEARKKARFVITQQNADLCESSIVLGYSQVVNRFTGEIVDDFFNIGVCQECGNRLPVKGHCPCQI